MRRRSVSMFEHVGEEEAAKPQAAARVEIRLFCRRLLRTAPLRAGTPPTFLEQRLERKKKEVSKKEHSTPSSSKHFA